MMLSQSAHDVRFLYDLRAPMAQGDVPLSAIAPQVIMGDYFGEYHRIGGEVQWALTALAAVTFTSAVALTRGCCP